MTVLLSNKLYCPAEQPLPLQDWTYRWTERVADDVTDDLGNVLLDARGQNQVRYRQVQHQFESYKQLTGQRCFTALPRGDLQKLAPYLDDVHDCRPVSILPFPLRIADHVFRDHRWPAQKQVVDQWLQHGYGIIQSTTGSGKTIMGIAVMAALGLRTLVLSTLVDGNQQWEREIRRHTNVDQWEERFRCKLVGTYRSRKQPFPLSVGTVQTFLHDVGYRSLIKHQNDFSLILVDECSGFAAPEFSRLLSLWNPLSFCGLDATPTRPDHRHKLLFDLIGPIVAKGTADQMRPTVKIVMTGVGAPAWLYGQSFPRHYRWIKTHEFLESFEPRNQIILDRLMGDIEAGRVVAVVSERRKIVQWLQQKLKQNHYDVAYVDGGTRNRDKIYKDFCNGVYQCLLAGKVMNKLVNLPELDCLHVATPAIGRERILQIIGRARREMAGKAIPEVTYYCDHRGQMDAGRRAWIKLCKQEGWQVEIIEAPSTGVTKWKPKN